MTTKTKRVTKAQAERVFRTFKKKYAGHGVEDAVLALNWTPEGHPAICWEGHVYEWALVWDNEADSPAGVFCEPYYGCVLAIYPDPFAPKKPAPKGTVRRGQAGYPTHLANLLHF